jgi:tRNA(fMet)-specific endonuclease VapC
MKRQRYLLDTCICICWLRDKFDVRERINAVGFDNCCISEMTVAELKVGKILGQLKGGPKYKDQPMKEFFDAITVIPVSPIIDRYAEEKARLTLMGKPTGELDLLIGCTAVAKKMIMVTENVDDFENIKDIQIENWLEGKREKV